MNSSLQYGFAKSEVFVLHLRNGTLLSNCAKMTISTLPSLP